MLALLTVCSITLFLNTIFSQILLSMVLFCLLFLEFEVVRVIAVYFANYVFTVNGWDLGLHLIIADG